MTHRYICLLRPPSSFTLPPGLVWDYAELPPDLARTAHVRRDLPVSQHRHGVIETVRPLTPEECERFDLTPDYDVKGINGIREDIDGEAV
ncbi:MAG: hypothetical protein ACXWHZ_03695 [Usitatibacter sp.]